MKKLFFWILNQILIHFRTPIITFYTDCFDGEAENRVWNNLLIQTPKGQAKVAELEQYSYRDGALKLLNIVSVWLATGARGNVCVANIAPRHIGSYKNGPPFCFTWIKGNLVIATPGCFAGLIYEGLVNPSQVFETDVFEVCSKFLSQKKAQEIAETQFRSLYYVPRLIRWLLIWRSVPCKPVDLKVFDEFKPECQEVFFTDNFGNLHLLMKKTEIVAIQHAGKRLCGFDTDSTRYKVNIYPTLADAPIDGSPVFVVGSGGNGRINLLIRGGNASNFLNIKAGDVLNFV